MKKFILILLSIIGLMRGLYFIYDYKTFILVNRYPEISETDIIYNNDYNQIEFDKDEFEDIIKDVKVKKVSSYDSVPLNSYEIRLDNYVFVMYYLESGYQHYGIGIVDKTKNPYIQHHYKDLSGKLYEYLENCEVKDSGINEK